MCNLYNVTTNQEAIRAITKALDRLGNLQPSLDIYPDQMAPIVRNIDGIREMTWMRWGMPSSQQALYQAATKRADKLRAKGKDVDFQETAENGAGRWARQTSGTRPASTGFAGLASRTVASFRSRVSPNPIQRARWKAAGHRTRGSLATRREPLMFFAGLWVRDWECVRKVKEGLIRCDLFAFLTTEPNAVVAPIHPKAMPVILSSEVEVERWLSAPWSKRQKGCSVLSPRVNWCCFRSEWLHARPPLLNRHCCRRLHGSCATTMPLVGSVNCTLEGRGLDSGSAGVVEQAYPALSAIRE
jgi:putative SOS response-associated peptidase YedK